MAASPDEMAMKYFYYDSENRCGIESPAAIEGQVGDILATWGSLSRQSGSFLGVECPAGVAVQFMWDEPNGDY